MNKTTQEVLKVFGTIGGVAALITGTWGLCGHDNRKKAHNLYNTINTKFNLYQMVNKTPPPLIIRYKFDLYRTIEEETGYWSDYNGLLTSQIQQRKLTELKKCLPENPDNWSADQKETHDYAVKSATEFINTKMSTYKYIQTLKEDLNNFKVDINQPSNTTNTSTQIPDAIKLSMRHNFAVKSRG